MINFIKNQTLFASLIMGTCWAMWVVLGKKSGLSKDWLNLATVLVPAVVVLPQLFFRKGGVSFETPTVGSFLLLVVTSATCTAGLLFMRSFLVAGVEVSKYVVIAQAITPVLVVALSVWLLGEPMTMKKVFGIMLAGAGVYLIKSG